MTPKPTLTDDDRAKMRGKMGKEIAAMVANGEVTPEAAGAMLLDRETRKAEKNGLATAPAAA